MRKTLIFNLLLLAAMAACTPDGISDHHTDPGEANSGNVSIATLKSLYKNGPLHIRSEWRISGRIVSDDRWGNFYNTLVVEDGTGGIELKLDMTELFKHFGMHRGVTVRLCGLWLGSIGGTLQLGGEPWERYQTRFLDEGDIARHIAVDEGYPSEKLPKPATIAELTPAAISTYVLFGRVQFIDDERGMEWAAPPPSGADDPRERATERHLIDPAGDTLVVRTSGWASFARNRLPDGSGSILGVVGYRSGKYNLTVNHANAAIMTEPRF